MIKFITPREAAHLVDDHATVAMSGHAGFGTADAILQALQQQYALTGKPAQLTLVKAAGAGDGGRRGGDRLAAPGCIRTLITSHVGLEPKLAEAIRTERCLAYMLPAGTIFRLYQACARGENGFLTEVGLGTTADPRYEGSCGNARTRKEGKPLVSVETVQGKEYLYYRTFPIQVGIIRGSIADETGNISLEHEDMIGEQLQIAMAVKQSGGIVLVQVADLVRRGKLDPRQVTIPRHLVDYVTVVRQRDVWTEIVPDPDGGRPHEPLTVRKICARRAALELQPQELVNLGIGMPESIGSVLAEEGMESRIISASDSGVIGGVQLTGPEMGSALYPEAMIPMADMLSLCNGGGLDVCALGLAETDYLGNVNVSRFNGCVVGPGGFIDLTRKAKKIIFLGTFTAVGLQAHCERGTLCITQEGRYHKFKKQVEEITFSGVAAKQRGQKVLFVTERAVFTLTPAGWLLTEVAPGVDIRRHIIPFMDFSPRVAAHVKTMDARIFGETKMGLR